MKTNWIPYFALLIITVLYIEFKGYKNDKYIDSILKKDSLETKILNDKIHSLDSLNNILDQKDSILDLKIQSLNKSYIKSSNNYKNVAKSYINDTVILPDLGK